MYTTIALEPGDGPASTTQDSNAGKPRPSYRPPNEATSAPPRKPDGPGTGSVGGGGGGLPSRPARAMSRYGHRPARGARAQGRNPGRSLRALPAP